MLLNEVVPAEMCMIVNLNQDVMWEAKRAVVLTALTARSCLSPHEMNDPK